MAWRAPVKFLQVILHHLFLSLFPDRQKPSLDMSSFVSPQGLCMCCLNYLEISIPYFFSPPLPPPTLFKFQILELCLPLISRLNVTSLMILPNFSHSLTLHHNFQCLPSFGFITILISVYHNCIVLRCSLPLFCIKSEVLWGHKWCYICSLALFSVYRHLTGVPGIGCIRTLESPREILITDVQVLSSCVHACSIAQSHPTLWHPMDCSPSGSSVHEIFQVRILGQVALSSSRGSSWATDQTCISCISGIGRQILCH